MEQNHENFKIDQPVNPERQESPEEHIAELEEELKKDFAENRDADDTYLSPIFHKVGVLAAKDKTEYIGQLVAYAEKQKINLDKEVINSVKEAIHDLRESQYAALIFAEDLLTDAKETQDELVAEGKISDEDANDFLDQLKEGYGGIEFFDAVTTIITVSSLKPFLKDKTVERIRKLAPELVIHNSYVLNTLKRYSQHYGVDLESTMQSSSKKFLEDDIKRISHQPKPKRSA